jgi:hypothetical protein
LYCIGMVFFREGIEKQDFVLKYWMRNEECRMLNVEFWIFEF